MLRLVQRSVLTAALCLAAGEPSEAAPAARAAARAAARLGPHLQRALEDAPAHRSLAVWVDLVDKRPAGTLAPARVVSERSLRRRRKVLPASALVDGADLPLDATAVAAVAACVQSIRQRSRWFDAVSAAATPSQITALRALPCVRSIELVAHSVQRAPNAVPPPVPLGPGYGDSGRQLELLRVDALHDRGLTGLGVLVAHFDVGYHNLNHEVFRPMRIAAAYDFVDHDGNVGDARSNPDDTLEHGHWTLSVLAGFKPGKLVGVAPGASLILARTESTAYEAEAEEDAWIAALEWADSLGADIVSSSLKFLAYDIPGTGYSWQDMNGTTARVTRAADMAARRGILIVNGAGNEGDNPTHNTLVAPADGFEVLSVGAVTLGGARARFSSVGPTSDFPPRIKPDVMAPGVDIVTADVVNDSSYTLVSGTSLSCPLTAGVAALLLSVHDATPRQVRDALRLTASRALEPDNSWGWGVIDALAAYEYLIGLFPTDAGAAARPRYSLQFTNPFRPSNRIAFAAPRPAMLRIYDARGRRVREWSPASAATEISWDGADNGGHRLSRGMYFVELQPAAPDAPAVRRKLTLLR